MKKILFIVVIILLYSFTVDVYAFDEWTKTDSEFQLTYTVLHCVDWTQTRYIAKHPDIYYETNPLLGKHPTVDDVNKYFLITLLAHTAISYSLPSKYRRYWQWFTIGIESHAVTTNTFIGIKMEF